MGLLLLFSSGGGSSDPTADSALGALSATAVGSFVSGHWEIGARRHHRRGQAPPVHSRRTNTGYRVRHQGEIPVYLDPILLEGYAPPGVEQVWVEGYDGELTAVIAGGGGGPAAEMLALEHEERLDEYEILRFTIPALLPDGTANPKADLLDVDVRLHWRGRRFRISAREEERDDARTTVTIEAEALWLDLADVKQAGDYLVDQKTPVAGLTQILATSNWAVGSAVADVNTYTLTKTDASTLELVRAWAELTGYEVAWDTWNRRVSLVAQQGRDRGIGFRYGRNLRSILRRVEPPKATRLWVYGRDNIDITGEEPDELPFVTDFSYYTGQGLSPTEAEERYTKDRVWVTDIVSDSDLYAAALAEVAVTAQPTISYEMKVIDLLAVAGAGDVTFSIGDTVAVRDAPLDIDITTRVVRLIRRPLEPWRNEIELAYLQRAASDTNVARSTPGTSEWLLYIEENSDAVTLSGVTEHELSFFPRFLFLDGRGEYTGKAQVPATLSGAGVLNLRVVDALNANAEVGTASWSFNSATFATWTYLLSWRDKGLTGRQRLKVLGSITSGAGTASIADDTVRSDVLVRGLLVGTDPPVTNIEEFSVPGSYFWFVPDGVTSIVATLKGAQGDGQSNNTGGYGGLIKVRATVTPGEAINVNVGAAGNAGTGGFNGGGDGVGGAGGGASDLRRNALDLPDRFVVAGGGGGRSGNGHLGGGGGYPEGADAEDTSGSGGTQSVGGTNSGGGATDGTFGQGGTGSAAGTDEGGGGGGGWYGGGGGNGSSAGNGRGGGGGSSYYDAAQDVELLEDVTGEHGDAVGTPLGGYISIEW